MKSWTKKWNKPGKSQGSDLQTSASGMIEAGNGKDSTLRLRYCTTSSSSVGWNLKPGGNLSTPFLTKPSFSILVSMWFPLNKSKTPKLQGLNSSQDCDLESSMSSKYNPLNGRGYIGDGSIHLQQGESIISQEQESTRKIWWVWEVEKRERVLIVIGGEEKEGTFWKKKIILCEGNQILRELDSISPCFDAFLFKLK